MDHFARISSEKSALSPQPLPFIFKQPTSEQAIQNKKMQNTNIYKNAKRIYFLITTAILKMSISNLQGTVCYQSVEFRNSLGTAASWFYVIRGYPLNEKSLTMW